MKSKLLCFLLILAFSILISSCSNAPSFQNSRLEEKTAEIKVQSSPVQIGNKVGNEPPVFEINDTEGNRLNLKDLIASGRPVLLYFYATWCPYCHEDFSQLSKVYADYKNNVTIIAINLDADEAKDTIKNYKSKFPQLSEIYFTAADGKILIDYDITRTTTKYAIKEGKIVYAGSGVFSQKHWNILLSEMAR